MATKLPRMEGGRAYIWMTNPSKYHEAGRKKRLEKICVEGRNKRNKMWRCAVESPGSG